MIKFTAILGIELVALLLTGCGVPGSGIPASEFKSLEHGEQFELLSIDPEPIAIKRQRKEEVGADILHGWVVLGHTRIDDAQTRKRLNDALAAGAKGWGLGAKQCFNPRHAIRVTLAGTVVELVICFECSQVEVFKGESEYKSNSFLVSESPQSVFDDVLKSAGIPLAEEPK